MSAYEAMVWARELHKHQKRKYTGNPYADHLAEVAGIAGSVFDMSMCIAQETYLSVAWLHDSREDQGVTEQMLAERLNPMVAVGVTWLSDLEKGNRAYRKEASRYRLKRAPGWVQTIKVADLISNTSSIVEHDKDFARVYIEEKRQLLDVLSCAEPRLMALARQQLKSAFITLLADIPKEGS